MYNLNRAGVSSVLGRQHLPRHVIVQRLERAVHEDTIAQLLRDKRLDEIKDRVADRADVDHVHLLHLHRIRLLRAEQELSD